ncbi:hypothetical protein B0J11DRAFT_148198 [Dendryphion nanum]|uniref:Uncharacterized protein n=1 Tax=Dendryphion nanum TaxID=256645 RepID=A0A9P9ECG5_9PLEO|nr:hypothetical protein B0J11DRAFT_148198 [Dendryphion nanum]
MAYLCRQWNRTTLGLESCIHCVFSSCWPIKNSLSFSSHLFTICISTVSLFSFHLPLPLRTCLAASTQIAEGFANLLSAPQVMADGGSYHLLIDLNNFLIWGLMCIPTTISNCTATSGIDLLPAWLPLCKLTVIRLYRYQVPKIMERPICMRWGNFVSCKYLNFHVTPRGNLAGLVDM